MTTIQNPRSPRSPSPEKRSRLLALGAVAALTLLAPALRADSRSTFVTTQIAAHNAGLSAATRAEKYNEMSTSAAAFFRGTAHLYWSDFGTSPQLSTFGSSSTRIWLQGDAHIDNQGSFDNSAGTIVYDLNDFDESVIGDYQLDLWRLATSVVLLARENGGFSTADVDTVLDSLTDGYLDALASSDGNNSEQTRMITAANAFGLLDEFLTDVAHKDSRKQLLDKYTVKSGTTRTFNFTNKDLQPVPAALDQQLRDAVPAYGGTLSGGLHYSSSYFKVKSVAQRLHAGLGSLGTPRYYLLIEGASASPDDDRILDVKAQGSPTAFANLEPAARAQTDAASGSDPAQRVLKAAHALGRRVDEHLGRLSALGQPYSVRERSPYKEAFDTSKLTSLTRLTKLASQWGAVLATAHACADRDFDSTVIAYDFEHEVLLRIGSRKSLFKASVRQVAHSNADQVGTDFLTFKSWPGRT